MDSKKYICHDIQSKPDGSKIQISAVFSMLGLLSLCLVYSSLAQAWTFYDSIKSVSLDGGKVKVSPQLGENIARCLLDNQDQTTSPEPEDYWFYRSSKISERKCGASYWNWNTYFYPVGDLIYGKYHGLSVDESETKIHIQFRTHSRKLYGYDTGYMAPHDLSNESYLPSQSKPDISKIEYVYKLSIKLGENWVDIENLPIIDFSHNRSIQVDQKTIYESIEKYLHKISVKEVRNYLDKLKEIQKPPPSYDGNKLASKIAETLNNAKKLNNKKDGYTEDLISYTEDLIERVKGELSGFDSKSPNAPDSANTLNDISLPHNQTQSTDVINNITEYFDKNITKKLNELVAATREFGDSKESMKKVSNSTYTSRIVDILNNMKKVADDPLGSEEPNDFNSNSAYTSSIMDILGNPFFKALKRQIKLEKDLLVRPTYRLRVCSYSRFGYYFCEQLEKDIALLPEDSHDYTVRLNRGSQYDRLMAGVSDSPEIKSKLEKKSFAIDIPKSIYGFYTLNMNLDKDMFEDAVIHNQSNGSITALDSDLTIRCAGSKKNFCPPRGTGYSKFAATSFAFAALKKSDKSIHEWYMHDRNSKLDFASQQKSLSRPPKGKNNNRGFRKLVSSKYAFAGLKEDGSIYAWGVKKKGGCNVDPKRGYSSSGENCAPSGKTFTEIIANREAFAALAEDGRIHYWGGDFGACQEGDTCISSDNIVYTQLVAFDSVMFGALSKDGAIRVWRGPVGSTQYKGVRYIKLYGNNIGLVGLSEKGGLNLIFRGSVTCYKEGKKCAEGELESSKFIEIYSTFDEFIGLREDGSTLVWGLELTSDRMKIQSGKRNQFNRVCKGDIYRVRTSPRGYMVCDPKNKTLQYTPEFRGPWRDLIDGKM